MIKIDWHTVQASTPTHNRYWRPPREGKQPEASLSEWERFVKKHEASATINPLPFSPCMYGYVFPERMCVRVRAVFIPGKQLPISILLAP